jgi:hypothetical protein
MAENENNGEWFDHQPRKVGTDISKDANPQLLVFRQVDRKAAAATMGNLEAWMSGINEMIAQLPIRVK